MEKVCIWRETGGKDGVDYKYSQFMVENDGGRSEHFKGRTGDCVTRAIAIAAEKPYKEVYDALFERAKEFAKGRSKAAKVVAKDPSPRNGVRKEIYKDYLENELGWTWVPLMGIGTGCTIHARGDELPKGRLILRLSKHLTAMIDGVLHDTYDCTREGTRGVYGYWYKPS